MSRATRRPSAACTTLAEPTTRRDFIYVDDLIDVVYDAVVGGKGSGHYHASSGSDFSIKGSSTHRRGARDRAGERSRCVRAPRRTPSRSCSFPRGIREDCGWEPKTPLTEGVRQRDRLLRRIGIEQTFTHLKVASECA